MGELAVRYYEREHFDAYARIKAEGLDQWTDLHEELLGTRTSRTGCSSSARCRRWRPDSAFIAVLEPGGRYVLSTAVYERARDYGDAHIDTTTGIVWMRTAGPGSDARRIGRTWYLPHCRHLTAEALRAELESFGFGVIEQLRDGGNIVARAQ